MGKSAEIEPLSENGLLGCRVLVAEDESRTRWSYVGLLRDAGARVTEARDGLEALELARSQRPDLILADIAMPRLDGLGLCAALRREPGIEGVTVILLSDGEPPQAVWGSDTATRPLVDAVITALERHEAASGPPSHRRADSGSREPIDESEAKRVVDLAERENVRAQSTVAMHREPANRSPRGSHAVWRLRAIRTPRSGDGASGFGMELHAMSRILGVGFIALLAGTIGVLVWGQLALPGSPSRPTGGVAGVDSSSDASATTPLERVAPEHPGLTGFSGSLRPGVDPAIGAAPGEGALALDGPTGVLVTVDKVDRGSLPLSLPLDEGVHAVRYRFEEGFTDRFYYVKAGATRALRVITRPGGFVDAR